MILGYSYLIRPTNSIAVALFGLFFLINHPKRFGLYAVGVAGVLIPYAIHNWLTYQNVFPPYSYQLFERMASPGIFGEALIGTLISPGRGLFVFTPIFLFSIYGAYLAARQRRLSLHNIDLYLVAILIFHWIITSFFEDWGGRLVNRSTILRRCDSLFDVLAGARCSALPLDGASIQGHFPAGGSLQHSGSVPLLHEQLSVHVEWKTEGLGRSSREKMGLGGSAIPAGPLQPEPTRRQGTRLLVRRRWLSDARAVFFKSRPPFCSSTH